MIAGVLPFIGEVAERSRMIRAISEQWQCSTQTIRMTLEELLDDAKMDIQDLPDPTIGKLELRDYGYTAEDMVPLRKEAALDYHRMGSKIYCLGSDGDSLLHTLLLLRVPPVPLPPVLLFLLQYVLPLLFLLYFLRSPADLHLSSPVQMQRYSVILSVQRYAYSHLPFLSL